jgi:hypothetical protein
LRPSRRTRAQQQRAQQPRPHPTPHCPCHRDTRSRQTRGKKRNPSRRHPLQPTNSAGRSSLGSHFIKGKSPPIPAASNTQNVKCKRF